MGTIEHNQLSVSWLNGMVLSRPEALVSLSERIYYNQIEQITLSLVEQSNSFSILLVSGPSASTKTTTAMKLSQRFHERGVQSVVISLDNFFINRDLLPKLPDGTTDFESIDTLDLPLLDQCFESLLYKGMADFPIFDFPTGKRLLERQHITTNGDTIVIIEGIHALHPEVIRGHNPASFRKVYISPNSEYFFDNERVLGIRDVRLTRRLVRDFFHRGGAVQRTLEMWANVISSEVVNIIPYRTEADYILDSAIIYEPNIFERILANILETSQVSEEFQPKLMALTDSLKKFVPLDLTYVPGTTVLREFLE